MKYWRRFRNPSKASGGRVVVWGVDKMLMEETGLPVVVADDPLTCVARGGGRILELTEEHGPGISDWSNASDCPWSHFVAPTHPVGRRACCFAASCIACWHWA